MEADVVVPVDSRRRNDAVAVAVGVDDGSTGVTRDDRPVCVSRTAEQPKLCARTAPCDSKRSPQLGQRCVVGDAWAGSSARLPPASSLPAASAHVSRCCVSAYAAMYVWPQSGHANRASLSRSGQSSQYDRSAPSASNPVLQNSHAYAGSVGASASAAVDAAGSATVLSLAVLITAPTRRFRAGARSPPSPGNNHWNAVTVCSDTVTAGGSWPDATSA